MQLDDKGKLDAKLEQSQLLEEVSEAVVCFGLALHLVDEAGTRVMQVPAKQASVEDGQLLELLLRQ